jgi:hypothetical protein
VPAEQPTTLPRAEHPPGTSFGCLADAQRCHCRRDCSAPFHLAPYVGKPPAAVEAPDALEAQKLLAGMADRGADVAVVECAAEGLDAGRCGDARRALPAGLRRSRPAVMLLRGCRAAGGAGASLRSGFALTELAR